MKRLVCYLLPLILLGLHLLFMTILDEEGRFWFHSERGPTENITFLIFAASGVWALVLWKGSKTIIPRMRWFLLLFGVAAIFVALEEISYGQHYLGYDSPEWAEQYNKQKEVNLHNLGGDLMSVVMRRVAEIGLPFFGIIVPFVIMRYPVAYTPQDWTYYIMPRHELIMLLVLCVVIRVNYATGDGLFGVQRSDGLSELQELYWAMAGLIWVWIMSDRLAALKAGGSPVGNA